MLRSLLQLSSRYSGSKLVHSVSDLYATTVQIWARDPESVQILKRLDGVMFGGGPLDEGVGNALTAKGVKLCASYGWCVHRNIL